MAALSTTNNHHTHFERDRHGNLQTVVEGSRRHRSHSCSNSSTSKEREYRGVLDSQAMADNHALRTQISLTQESAAQIQRNEQAWRRRVIEQDEEIYRLLEQLDAKAKTIDRLEAKSRMFKRGSSGGGREHDLWEAIGRWRDEAEMKGKEVDILRCRVDERDAAIRLGEERLLAKNDKIVSLNDKIVHLNYKIADLKETLRWKFSR